MVEIMSPWKLEMGASSLAEGVRFRVWSAASEHVEVEVIGPSGMDYIAMQPAADGLWETTVRGLGPGARYKYRLNHGDSFPDPCSRSQPDGVHGPSEVVDPNAYRWHDLDWTGHGVQGLVLYECHVGAFSEAGTFDGVIAELGRLAALGVNAIELMPVAQAPGSRNWGYDSVDLYAPSHSYGGPTALKRLVDAAHQHGIAVILDVVYNHLGPEGNYLRQFSPYYFSERHRTPWGDALNYDGPNSLWVRRYVVDNARYWVQEYHVDGLRLDATFAIVDSSQPHVLQELATAAHAAAEPERQVILIAETSENDVRYLLPPEQGGYGFDIIWADDFHHCLQRYLCGDDEGYYQDYQGTIAEVARTIGQGFLFEGEWSTFLNRRRGTPAREQPAWQFQYCLQNHDQVGNRALGERLHHLIDLDRCRAASALLLFLPHTPLLFMGQEFAASSPFLFFTNHSPDLGRLVTEGRREEFVSYRAFSDPDRARQIPDPQALETFLRSKLDHSEADHGPGRGMWRLHQALLSLRASDPVLFHQDRTQLRAYPLQPDLLAVHRWRGKADRLLLANFGPDVSLALTTLLDDRAEEDWTVIVDTGSSEFGGAQGCIIADNQLDIPAHTAVILASG